MIYPGDMYVFTLPVERSDGAAPTVTVAPTLLVVNLVDGSVAYGPVAMTLVGGTQKIYKAVWPTAGLSDGTYLATVSYAAEGAVFNNRNLEKVRLGDSRVTSEVAKEATTAKEETSAKDATVLHLADYTDPDTSAIVLAIRDRIASFPTSIPSSAQMTTLTSMVADIRDVSMGSWSIDRAGGTLTLYRVDGSLLQTFNLVKTSTLSQRLRVG